MHFVIKFALFLISFSQILGYGARSKDVYFLEPGDRQKAPASFQIYCYAGKPKYLIHLWQSVVLHIDHPTNDYTVYDGTTPQKVEEEYEKHRDSWRFNIFSWKQKQLRINPFFQSCIGFHSEHPYTISLNVIRIDYWKVISLILGTFIFISANKLSQNQIFHYLCGTTLGICASLLIVIYFLSKLLPKSPLMYGVAAGAWTVGIYLIQLVWENIRLLLEQYKIFVVGYLAFTAFLSFLVCYRWGPVTNQRTKNLIRWTLQAVGLIFMYLSTEFTEAAMGEIVLLLMFYNIPPSVFTRSRKYCMQLIHTRYPPKRKLLTNDEYTRQGVEETAKALDELRKYCSSPDCNQWKTVLKLRNVKRFASFVEGDSHLSDQEMLSYESELYIDDEAFSEDEENGDLVSEDEF